MDTSHNLPPDPQPDWALLLPREAFHQIVFTLRRALPPPVSDDPAELVRRDRAAMAAVASLLPETAAEGRLAAQFVAADAWAMDCLRLAGERKREFEVARKCRAQATSLMREAKGALRALQGLQAARRKIAGDEDAAGRAAWAEHAAVGLMAEGMDDGEEGAKASGSRDGRQKLSSALPAPAPRGVDGRHKTGQDGAGHDGEELGGLAGAAPGGVDGARRSEGVGDVSSNGTSPGDVWRETDARLWPRFAKTGS